MSSLAVSIWYNQRNAKAQSFTEGFAQDLKRCLARYLPNTKLAVGFDDSKADYHYIVLTKEDVQDLLNQPRTKELKGKPQYYLKIEPLSTQSFEISAESQLHQFWDKQFETAEIRLYRRDNNETKANYWEKVTDLAIDIHSKVTASNLEVLKPRVYLSVDDSSNNTDRENLKRDLNDLGFIVLPNKPLSSSFEDCTLEISEMLSDSTLIIHIIPPVYNVFFTDSHLSLTEHQCNISAGLIYSTDSKITRIIWIPTAYEVSDEENQIFIEKIQRDQDQTRNSLVLKSSIEDLKKHYRKILLNENIQIEVNGDQNDQSIYLITDSQEFEGTIKNSMNGLNFRTPSDYTKITFTQHLNELARANVVVVGYSSQNDEWLAVKANDILKSKGLDAAKQFERIILVKSYKQLDTNKYEGVFTDVCVGTPQLEKVLFQVQQSI